VLERDDADTAAQLSVPGLAIIPSDRMTDVQWGKLLFNLNNAINALSNLPLREQLSQRPWRRILAAQMAEALAAMKAAGIVPHTSTPLPAALLPFVLRLPDGIFRAVAAQMLRIDPQARSSMWEDLQQGRRTEVDHLQGAIIRLASRHGLQAPLSERIVALVKAAEGMPKGSPGLNPERIMPAR
jgi:2-dehydropantoate 2-reductase